MSERSLIHDLAARGVDEVRALLHRVENIRADKRARLRLQSEMDADDIRLRARLPAELSTRSTPSIGGARRRQAATPRDDRHAEGAGARNHLPSDLPVPIKPSVRP